MTAADQIRALADTGTPGPWKSQPHSSRRDSTVILGGDSLGVGTFVAHYVANADDAAKIVAAVNALPHIADLIDVIDARHYVIGCDEPDCDTDCPGQCAADGEVPCPTISARDALVEALGVTA